MNIEEVKAFSKTDFNEIQDEETKDDNGKQKIEILKKAKTENNKAMQKLSLLGDLFNLDEEMQPQVY